MARDGRVKLAALAGLLVLTAAVPTTMGSGPAGAETPEPSPPQLPPPPELNRANLQVSPELVEVRSGLPIELTARIYHDLRVPVDVAFEAWDVVPRPRRERVRASRELVRCTITPPARACTVTFQRQHATTSIVSAWIESGPDALRDVDEGRLASFSRPPLADADCTIDDGEPINPNCRNDQDAPLAPGRAEPDGTDVVRASWTGLPEADLDCDDPGGHSGTDKELRPQDDRVVTYLCRARLRSNGEPMAGALLNAEIQGGPFDPDKGVNQPADYGNNLAADGGPRRLCMTSAPLGHCNFKFKVPMSGPGHAVLCLWIDSDNDGLVGRGVEDGGGCVNEPVEEVEANDETESVLVELHS